MCKMDKNTFKFTVVPKVYADRMITKQEYRAIQRWTRQCRVEVVKQITTHTTDLMVYGYAV